MRHRSIIYSLFLLPALAAPAIAMHVFTRDTNGTPMEIAQPARIISPAETRLLLLQSKYREMEEAGGWPAFPMGEKITPGSHDARIPALRRILDMQGDLAKDSAQAPASATLYDETLQAAVRQFQERHGLNDDAVIGKETQQALATSVSFRLKQIAATLSRLRKENEVTASSRYILVNIPEYRLYGMEQGNSTLEMKVIVGDVKHQTPVFNNAVSAVSFNPDWGVPVKIATQELLPKIIKDPDYLQKNNYGVFTTSNGHRSEIDPATVDWTALGRHHFPYQLRQRAGEFNALGKVKFVLTDSDDIYLHDTSRPSLFAKDMRALSHGCIRVEHPRELVYFTMKPKEGYDTDKIDKLYNSDATRTILVPDVPVTVVYHTAWMDDTGKAHFRKDIYGLDAKFRGNEISTPL